MPHYCAEAPATEAEIRLELLTQRMTQSARDHSRPKRPILEKGAERNAKRNDNPFEHSHANFFLAIL